MRVRERLAWMKWWGAFGVALILHIVSLWIWLPQALPPPVVQPASTRVLLISLSSPEPEIVVEDFVPNSIPEVVGLPPALVVEESPVDVEIDDPETDPESELAFVPVPAPKVIPDPEPELEQIIVDEGETALKSSPFDDSVLAVEDYTDVDGRFDVPPRALQTIKPNYPLEARREQREGDVLCEALITKRGRVERVHIVLGSGYRELDSAALVALRRARFEPATRRGQSVEATVQITIVFRLKGL